MVFDWVAAAKWLGPKALALARKISSENEAANLQLRRNDHAMAAAAEIARMILSGFTTESANLSNLVLEYELLLDRGAKVPLDLSSMVGQLIEKARSAQCAEYRSDYRPSVGHYRPKIAAKKAPARKMAASNPSARKLAAKKAPAKKVAAKKTSAKKAVKMVGFR